MNNSEKGSAGPQQRFKRLRNPAADDVILELLRPMRAGRSCSGRRSSDGQMISTLIIEAGDHASDLRFCVELRGFEPLTPSMRTRCATGLRYSPKNASQRSKLVAVLAHIMRVSGGGVGARTGVGRALAGSGRARIGWSNCRATRCEGARRGRKARRGGKLGRRCREGAFCGGIWADR